MSALLDTPLDGRTWPEWLEATANVLGELGHVKPLGDHHAAILTRRDSKTLLVSFENHARIDTVSPMAQPVGWQLVEALQWSHLCLACDQDTWFRDRAIFAYFDQLIDDGFFEEFDQVLFYGAGSCGYAAAAFSVAAPGARVLAVQPQATLDPRVAEWDDRFMAMRRVSFMDRYGYAPDMLDAADRAVVVYDPDIELDAMHVALFTRPNVMKFRMRFMGTGLDGALARMNILLRMLAQLNSGKLTRLSLSRLYRSRREDAAYQYNVLRQTTENGRHRLTLNVCNHVLARRQAKPFLRAVVRANRALEDETASD